MLFHFDTGCGVGLAATEDIDLSVDKNLLREGRIGSCVIYGSSRGCEQSLKRQVFQHREPIGIIGQAVAPLFKLIALVCNRIVIG